MVSFAIVILSFHLLAAGAAGHRTQEEHDFPARLLKTVGTLMSVGGSYTIPSAPQPKAVRLPWNTDSPSTELAYERHLANHPERKASRPMLKRPGSFKGRAFAQARHVDAYTTDKTAMEPDGPKQLNRPTGLEPGDHRVATSPSAPVFADKHHQANHPEQEASKPVLERPGSFNGGAFAKTSNIGAYSTDTTAMEPDVFKRVGPPTGSQPGDRRHSASLSRAASPDILHVAHRPEEIAGKPVMEQPGSFKGRALGQTRNVGAYTTDKTATELDGLKQLVRLTGFEPSDLRPIDSPSTAATADIRHYYPEQKASKVVLEQPGLFKGRAFAQTRNAGAYSIDTWTKNARELKRLSRLARREPGARRHAVSPSTAANSNIRHAANYPEQKTSKVVLEQPGSFKGRALAHTRNIDAYSMGETAIEADRLEPLSRLPGPEPSDRRPSTSFSAAANADFRHAVNHPERKVSKPVLEQPGSFKRHAFARTRNAGSYSTDKSTNERKSSRWTGPEPSDRPGVAHAISMQSMAAPGPIKLTGFDIEVEKVCLAFVIGGIKLADYRMKVGSTAPVAQSGEILRWAGQLSGLYPPEHLPKIEEAAGIAAQMQRELMASTYSGMRPHSYGRELDMPYEDRTAIQTRLRETVMKPDGGLPRLLGHLQDFLGDNQYMCGDKVTIADCHIIPQLRQLTNGGLDGIPTTILDGFPKLEAYFDRFHAINEVNTYYAFPEADPSQ